MLPLLTFASHSRRWQESVCLVVNYALGERCHQSLSISTKYVGSARKSKDSWEGLGEPGSLGGRDLKSGRMGINCMSGRAEGKEEH